MKELVAKGVAAVKKVGAAFVAALKALVVGTVKAFVEEIKK